MTNFLRILTAGGKRFSETEASQKATTSPSLSTTSGSATPSGGFTIPSRSTYAREGPLRASW